MGRAASAQVRVRADMLANHRQAIFALIASQFTAVSLAFVATSL